MKKFLKFVAISVFIYFGIALTLVFLPVPDSEVRDGLDFERLSIKFDTYMGEEKRFEARDGSSLFYRDFAAESDTILLLYHGSSSEGMYMSQIADAVSKSGVARVAVFDLRGHGMSKDRSGDVDYIGQLEDDISDFIKQEKARNANSKIVLGGHSSGGGLAVRYGGYENALEVDGYLLLAPYLGYDSPTVRGDAGGWATPYMKRIIGLSMLNNVGIHAFDHLTAIRFNLPEAFQYPLATLEYTYRMNVSYGPRGYGEDLSEIAAPILVLVGADDEAFYADAFGEVFEEYAASQRVEVIPNCGHLDLVSNEKAIAASIAWLRELGVN